MFPLYTFNTTCTFLAKQYFWWQLWCSPLKLLLRKFPVYCLRQQWSEISTSLLLSDELNTNRLKVLVTLPCDGGKNLHGADEWRWKKRAASSRKPSRERTNMEVTAGAFQSQLINTQSGLCVFIFTLTCSWRKCDHSAALNFGMNNQKNCSQTLTDIW